MVTATIRNNGPGILTSGTVVMRFDSFTRNGQPKTFPLVNEVSYTGSLVPGQEVTRSLAMGPDLGMPSVTMSSDCGWIRTTRSPSTTRTTTCRRSCGSMSCDGIFWWGR